VNPPQLCHLSSSSPVTSSISHHLASTDLHFSFPPIFSAPRLSTKLPFFVSDPQNVFATTRHVHPLQPAAHHRHFPTFHRRGQRKRHSRQYSRLLTFYFFPNPNTIFDLFISHTWTTNTASTSISAPLPPTNSPPDFLDSAACDTSLRHFCLHFFLLSFDRHISALIFPPVTLLFLIPAHIIIGRTFRVIERTNGRVGSPLTN
jgi:hypothetical protein